MLRIKIDHINFVSINFFTCKKWPSEKCNWSRETTGNTFFRIFVFFSVSRNDRNSAKQWPVSYSFVFRETKKKYETVNPTADLWGKLLPFFNWLRICQEIQCSILVCGAIHSPSPKLCLAMHYLIHACGLDLHAHTAGQNLRRWGGL